MNRNTKFLLTYYNNIARVYRSGPKKDDAYYDCWGNAHVGGVIYEVIGWERPKKDGGMYLKLWFKEYKEKKSKSDPHAEWWHEYQDCGTKRMKKNAKAS